MSTKHSLLYSNTTTGGQTEYTLIIPKISVNSFEESGAIKQVDFSLSVFQFDSKGHFDEYLTLENKMTYSELPNEDGRYLEKSTFHMIDSFFDHGDNALPYSLELNISSNDFGASTHAHFYQLVTYYVLVPMQPWPYNIALNNAVLPSKEFHFHTEQDVPPEPLNPYEIQQKLGSLVDQDNIDVDAQKLAMFLQLVDEDLDVKFGEPQGDGQPFASDLMDYFADNYGHATVSAIDKGELEKAINHIDGDDHIIDILSVISNGDGDLIGSYDVNDQDINQAVHKILQELDGNAAGNNLDPEPSSSDPVSNEPVANEPAPADATVVEVPAAQAMSVDSVLEVMGQFIDMNPVDHLA